MLLRANILSLITIHQVVDKYWIEPYGDRRQEIVFIGTRTMQQKRIVDALDGSLLTDAEFKRGPKAWAKLEDPIAVLSMTTSWNILMSLMKKMRTRVNPMTRQTLLPSSAAVRLENGTARPCSQ